MSSDEKSLQCELLVVRWQRGDRSAFALIAAMWEQPLFYYLRRLVTTEAEAWDVLQETWLKVLHSKGSLRDPRAFPAFIYHVARNTAISRIRQRGTCERIECPVETLDDTLESPADEVALYDQAEQVHHALDRLPQPQREALTLYFLQDLSLEEIATLVGVPVGTVKSRLHYGKAALRRLLSSGDEHV